jgi:hypothetical protein
MLVTVEDADDGKCGRCCDGGEFASGAGGGFM